MSDFLKMMAKQSVERVSAAQRSVRSTDLDLPVVPLALGTFDVIASSETSPKPAQLAGGISLALVTTFMGLLVAIPMTVLFVVFRNKVVSTVLEVGALTEELMEKFKNK